MELPKSHRLRWRLSHRKKKVEAAPADEHTKDFPELVGESNDDDRGEDYALEAWLALWPNKAAVAAEVRV